MTSEPASAPEPDIQGSLLDLLPVGILILDGDGHVRAANPAAESLLGVKAGEMHDRMAIRAALDIVCRDSSQVRLQEVDLRQLAQQHAHGTSVEMALARPDGSLVWLNLRATNVPGGLAVTLENAGPRIHDTATLEAHTRLVEQANTLALEDLLRAALDEIELLTCSTAAGYFLVDEDQTNIVLQVASSHTDARAFFGENRRLPRPIDTATSLLQVIRKQTVALRNDGRGVAREMIVPVVREEAVRAVIVLRDKPFHYDDADVRVAERLANLSWELASLKLARREAEQRADQICKVASSAPGLVCMLRLTPEGRFTLHHVHVDDDFYGIPVSELGTDTSRLIQMVHPDDAAGLAEAVATSARDLTLHHHRWRFRHPTKGLRWHEVWAAPQREADGTTVWHGLLMDVTTQVQTEVAAAKHAARVEEAFDQAAIGMTLTSPDLKVLKANQAFCSIVGYSQEELVGADSLSFTHPDDREASLAIRAGQPKQADSRLEKRYLHKDGRVIWAQVDFSVVRGDDGNPTYFVTQVQDITSRKQADQERELTLQVLRILNRTDDVAATATQILSAIRTAMGLDAGAIRLSQDGDFAYVALEGFSDEFIRSERCFFEREDGDPEPPFDCICRRVMEGQVESGNATFTVAGSACIDNSPASISTPSQREHRQNPRNRCYHFGYQSVLTVPVRSGERIVAALQLNDRRAHVFTPEQVSFLEGIAPTIGLALERKLTAERLARSQRQLEITSQAAGAGYWRWSPRPDRSDWSPAFRSLLGLDPNDRSPAVDSWLGAAHPDDRKMILETAKRMAATGEDIDFEWRALLPDGRMRWLLSRCRCEERVDGRPGTYAGITIDITERKHMEEALRASEERFSRAFQSTPALALIVRAADNIVLDANQEFCRLTQFPPDEIIGNALTSLGLLDEDEHRKLAEQIAREGQLREHEIVLRPKDGSHLDCLLSVEVFDLHGEKLLLAMAMDISERKRSQAALRENEERFRLLIEHAPAALALFDNDMRYLAASQRWMDDYGLAGREVLGKSHYEIFPEIGERWKAVHRRALNGETITASEDRFERDDGSVQWLRWEVLPWHRADGAIGGILIFSEDITARKLAELESNSNRAKLATALKSMTDAVFISDLEGRFIDYNEAFAKFHRLRSTNDCPRTFAEYLPVRELFFPSGEVAPADQWPVPRALRGESVSNAEYTVRSKESGETWIGSYSFAPIRDEAGAIAGAVVVARDVTDQKRDSERFRQISQAAKEWIWEVDADGLYTYSSPVVEQLLGYSPDDLVGRQHYYDLWPEQMRQTLMPFAAEMFRTKQSLVNVPNTCLHKDGHWVLIETTGFPILGPKGELLGYRGADRDVTEREEALVKLRESEIRFRELFEHSPIAVWEEDLSAVATRFNELRAEGVTDLSAYLDKRPDQVLDLVSRVRILNVNEASLKLFGVTSADELPRSIASQPIDGALAVFRNNMSRFFAGQTTIEAELPYLDVRGTPLDLQVRMSVMPEHAHDLSRILVSFIDLTARKTAEAERRQLEREVNHLQRLDSLGRLASGVSHDMNNVLGAIMAIGSLLKAKHKNDPSLSKDAEALLSASIRGRDLVKGLRDFSRKELQSAQQLDLNDILRREADLLERTSLKRVTIVLDLARNLPSVFGESSSIQNALMNLCLNAMDAMPEKGTLTLSSRDLGQGFVELGVEDTGEGMSPEVQARALEPFFTTKPIGKGTGLGLSQVYGTVKAHGGTLDIKSKAGAGTRISMVFPSAQSLADRLAPQNKGLGAPARPLKILLVDDEEMIRGTVLSLLDVLGHQAQAASSGLEALRRLDAEMEVDLVVLDINMPGMDGVETLSRLRIARPNLKVLFATGFADDRIPSILKRFPEVRILKKPFSITELERALSDW